MANAPSLVLRCSAAQTGAAAMAPNRTNLGYPPELEFAIAEDELFVLATPSLAHVTAVISGVNIGIRASSALTLRKGDRLCGRREHGHKAG
jgi:hypothetical protein